MSNHDTPDQEETFKPFSWFARSGQSSPDDFLAEAAQDIGAGIQLVLQIIEKSNLADEACERPLLHRGQRGELMRLALTSARLLSDAAEQHIDWVNDQRYKQRKSQSSPQ